MNIKSDLYNRYMEDMKEYKGIFSRNDLIDNIINYSLQVYGLDNISIGLDLINVASEKEIDNEIASGKGNNLYCEWVDNVYDYFDLIDIINGYKGVNLDYIYNESTFFESIDYNKKEGILRVAYKNIVIDLINTDNGIGIRGVDYEI